MAVLVVVLDEELELLEEEVLLLAVVYEVGAGSIARSRL
jgi:hypothetical protein